MINRGRGKSTVQRSPDSSRKQPTRAATPQANTLAGFALLLVILNWLAYANSFQAGWHFDDGPNIIGNPDILISDLSWNSLVQAASTSLGGKRPISYLSFAANYYLWGEDAFSFHVVNFLIHSLNALLVFRIFSTLLAKTDPQRQPTEVWLLSSLAAALWSVNPVHT